MYAQMLHMSHKISCLLTFLTELAGGIEQASYSVVEGDAFVEVCASFSGTDAVTFNGSLSTSNLLAEGQ